MGRIIFSGLLGLALLASTSAMNSPARRLGTARSAASNNRSPLSSEVPTVAFCDLFGHPNRYDNRLIRVRTILVENHRPSIDGGEPFFYDPACYSEDVTMLVKESATVDYADPQVKQSLVRLRERQDAAGYSRVSIIVTGRFSAPKGIRYGHLDQFRYQFEITRIEQVKPVANGTLWPWKIKRTGPISKAEAQVKSLNDEFVFYYVTGRNDFPVLDSLSENFTFANSSSEVKNRTQFIETMKSVSFTGKVVNSNVKIFVSGNSATVTGQIIKSQSDITERYCYTNKFVRWQGRWRVRSLEVNTKDDCPS